MCTSHLSFAWLLQGGNAWTQEEEEALTSSIAAAGSDEDRDWDPIANFPGLENRTGVRILIHALARLQSEAPSCQHVHVVLTFS